MKIAQSAFQRLPPSLKDRQVAFWFGLSFIAPLYYGLVSFWYATSSTYVVQDDARYHIAWLQRLIDPALFPNDAIADYYHAIQGVGFSTFYQGVAALGIEPLFFAKVLPLLLALVATAYLFWVALLVLPVPICGLLTTLILNQNIWIRDDLISASPRAFVYPLFSAFLYYLLRGKRAGCLVSLGILGSFYPQMALVGVGLLTVRLVRWQGPRPRLSARSRDFAVWLIAVVMTGATLLLFSHQVTAQAGRLASLAEMKAWPEFQPGGRGGYFGYPKLLFWFDGLSGLRFPLFPPVIWLGAMLPLVVWKVPDYFAKAFPLSDAITHRASVLGQLFVASVGLFFCAHIIFPTLFLPSRYSFYSMRFVLILAAGVMLTLVMECWVAWLGEQWLQRGRWSVQETGQIVGSVGLAIAVVIVPAVPQLFLTGQSWQVGTHESLYDHIAQSPKDSLIVSLVREVNDNVPAFSERSVLVGREFVLPYHIDFYGEMRQRMRDLVTAQYSPALLEVQAFIEAYGVDLWILAQDFTDVNYLNQQAWLLQSLERRAVTVADEALESGVEPALVRVIPQCTTFRSERLIVLDAGCIATAE
ncbi:MAG: hypothetical protein AAFO83_03225 [Cyanobacteria bacterium J06607_13]